MTILRICVWLVPGIILIIGSLLAVRVEAPLRIALPLILCVFTALGYFDMRLMLQIEKADPAPLKRRVLGWALAFALVQIIIAPAVALGVTYMYFMIMNRGAYYP